MYASVSRDISIYGTSLGRFVQKVIVSCFSDGHGNYDSNLVSFRIKSLKQTKSVTVSKSNECSQGIQNAS